MIVKTSLGEIEGIDRKDHLEFRGIPYAKPPVAERRFRAPEPVEPWEAVYPAKRFGHACPQEASEMLNVGETSEDCLYLNIWTPAADNKKRPVMVWYHGGGFLIGSGSQLIYRGRDLALGGDVVVVTLNYRLGAFGFLHLEDFLKEEAQGAANNVGLLDQIAALQWVKNNIEHFGGDAEQITVFGESAGAMAVATLITTPKAKGLIKRAIIQSGSANQVLNSEDAQKVSTTFFEALEIDPDQPEKLWQLSAEQILVGQKACREVTTDRGLHRQSVPQKWMSFVPLVDGNILPQAPMAAIKEGAAADIPLLISYTRDEWNLILHLPNDNGLSLAKSKYKDMDKLELIKVCESNLPGLGEPTANLYEKVVKARNPDASFIDMYSAFQTDRMLRIPSLRIAYEQSMHNPNVFVCCFSWDKCVFGACHVVDVPFVFGSVQKGVGKFLTGGGEQAEKLSDKIQTSWIAFARSGNPGTDAIGAWPGYDAKDRQVMIFDDEVRIEKDPAKETRKHWKGIL